MKLTMNWETLPHIASIRELLGHALFRGENHLAFRYKDATVPGGIRDVTIGQFYAQVEALGARLCELGLSHAHIGCVGENSYPWIVTYLSVMQGGNVFVPLDKELPEDDLLYLIREGDCETVFCDAAHEEILRARREEIPGVRYLISFAQDTHGEEALSFSALCREGEASDKREYDNASTPEGELKYLVYTSGTTGVAKGVMLTEHNVVSCVYYGMQVSRMTDVCLSVLPYHHTYAAVCDILVAIFGGTTLCINDSLRHVQDNMKLFHPTCILLVPAFAEHFYKGIQNALQRKKQEKKFAHAQKISRFLLGFGIDVRRRLFARILAEFGGKLEKIVCGGAPIRPEIGAFFGSIGISMTGGYGITECSPLVSLNDDRNNNYASAGRPIPCVSWKISEPDEEGIGEIVVRGDVVMSGYYKRPDLTAEVLRDGWFYTGDYGYINQKGEIVITGRKKNIIVLSNGKNVYPEDIERFLAPVPGVLEVVVSGIRNEHGQDVALTASVYTEEEGHTAEEFVSAFRRATAHLPAYKQISTVTLRSEPFPKTTTNKIKRS